MKKAWIALGVLAGCGSGGDVQPQDGSSAPPAFVFEKPVGVPGAPAALPANIPAPDPLLIAGDVITVSVFRQPDLLLEVRIPQEGSISYPLIGSVAAAGKTTVALQKEIRDRLEKDYLNDPSVSVTVKEYAPRKVYVVGGVEKPDAYVVSPTSRLTLLQLVASAGGTTDKAYKEYVQIVRRRSGTREVIRLSLLDVEREVAKGHPQADLELWPDDLVVIPSAQRVAYVLGAVNKPGPVEIPSDSRMTVSMAVSHAGSYNKFAATSSVQVLRRTLSGETRKLSVDLDAALDGDFERDIVLLPGDVVWVPERGIF